MKTKLLLIIIITFFCVGCSSYTPMTKVCPAYERQVKDKDKKPKYNYKVLAKNSHAVTPKLSKKNRFDPKKYYSKKR